MLSMRTRLSLRMSQDGGTPKCGTKRSDSLQDAKFPE
jgi:hypothetical protein